MHIGHRAIIDYCGRPFQNVEEMNEALINNWNSVVNENDIVFNLGDFCFGGSTLWHTSLDKLKGTHYLIKGNHERQNFRKSYADRFDGVYQQLFIEVDGQGIYLNHLPFSTFDGCQGRNKLNWQLFGHVHTSKYKNTGCDFERICQTALPTQYDVGSDLNDFTPIPYQKVKERIEFQIERGVNTTYWINNE